MTDRGSFQVSTATLREHAHFWLDHAADAKIAQMAIESGVGKGADFGLLAGRYGVEEAYDSWSNAMATCLESAQQTFIYLATALASVANDYDGVDATVASSMDRIDPMNEVS